MTALSTPTRRTRERRSLLGDGWPLYTLLWGYPLWWVLGVSAAGWVVLAVPCLFWLWSRSTVRVPRGLGPWVLFLAWMFLSVTQLASLDDIRSFSVRAAFYVAAGIYLVYAYNLPEAGGHRRRLLMATMWFFSFVVAISLAAAVLPFSEFTTPFEAILPGALASNPFVRELVHGQIAQVHTFLGFPVPRPAAPFAFTNQWGAALGVLAPIVVYGASQVRRGWIRVATWSIVAASVLPIAYSLNRGLWLSLAAAGTYAAVRLAVRGRARPLVNIVMAVLIAAVLVLATPLGGLVFDRLDTGHSNDRRTDLVGQSIETTLESPVFGHGGPVPDPDSPTRAPIGTHGQLWLLGVSHGVVGAALYVVAIGLFWLRTLAGSERDLAFWVNVSVFVALVQLPFYDHLFVPLQFIFVFVALATQEIEQRSRKRQRPAALLR